MNGLNAVFLDHTLHKVYDLLTKSEYILSAADTNPQIISNVVGFLVKQVSISSTLYTRVFCTKAYFWRQNPLLKPKRN